MTVEAIKLEKCVVDASVALKWFFEEPGTHRAQSLLDQSFRNKVEIYAPDFLVYEVSNVLWKGKKVPVAEIENAIEAIFNSPVELIVLDKLLALSSSRFMAKYNLTFYDAIYAAIAEDLNLPLLTADVKDFKKIKEIEVIEL